jgi:hypothetical protein
LNERRHTMHGGIATSDLASESAYRTKFWWILERALNSPTRAVASESILGVFSDEGNFGGTERASRGDKPSSK